MNKTLVAVLGIGLLVVGTLALNRKTSAPSRIAAAQAAVTIAPPATPSAGMNHLEGQTSPYLQRAQHQPVDWYPWSREAFAKARQLNRPILLDVGAVWCSWCERMDRESYSQPELADFINQNFVAIKVDFDANPEFSAKLSRVQAIANLPTGLPLVAVVTPDGLLFSGGAYFPPRASGGKPGFRDTLNAALLEYRQHRDQVTRDGSDLELEKGWKE